MNVFVLVVEFVDQVEIFVVSYEVDVLGMCQVFNEKGFCVMLGLVVFRIWVFQVNDQLYGSYDGSFFL